MPEAAVGAVKDTLSEAGGFNRLSPVSGPTYVDMPAGGMRIRRGSAYVGASGFWTITGMPRAAASPTSSA